MVEHVPSMHRATKSKGKKYINILKMTGLMVAHNMNIQKEPMNRS